jgi:pilus assembly protein CpaE
MPASIRLLVALDSGTERDTVEAVLPVEPGLELVGVVDSLDESWHELAHGNVDAVLVGCEESPDSALAFTEGVSANFPDRAVLLLSFGTVNGFAGRALAAGAEDVVELPVSGGEPPSPEERERTAQELAAALRKGVARRRRATSGPRVAQGRMIAVIGPKGGAGKTFVSSNLAVGLAHAGERVVLVDLDLQFGDAGLTLGLPPSQTVYDLVTSGGSLDAEKLADYLVPHESGARVLQAPARPDQAAFVEIGFLRHLFDVLRATEDWIVIDSAPGFTPEVIAAIDAATDVCMVGTVDAASLKNTKLGLEALELMGVELDQLRLVLNRSDSRVGVSPEDAHAVNGREADVLIPSHRDIARSASEARPIVLSQPRSQAGRALRGLVESYMGAGDRRRNGGSSLMRVFARRD